MTAERAVSAGPTLPTEPPIDLPPTTVTTELPTTVTTEPPTTVTTQPPTTVTTDPTPPVSGTSSPPPATSNPPSTSTPRRPPSSGPGTSTSQSTEGTSPATGSSGPEPPGSVDESSIPDPQSDPDDGSTSSLPGEVAVSELDIVTAAARVEALAVEAYTMARSATTDGGFGDVPPAIVDYLDTAHRHHEIALETWNRVLATDGRPTVVGAPANLATAIAEQFAAAIDGLGAARVALGVEKTAAATYLNALGNLISEPAIRLAGSMLSIDQQHISLLLFAVGEYPVPESFATAELAGTDA